MSPHRSPGVRLGMAIALVVLLGAGTACASGPKRARVVKATAYNSTVAQTDDQPRMAAWGDTLSEDMRVIAVSRDLLDQGLTRGTRVRIEGLSGEFVVLDKMAPHWRNKIDIYMGEDVDAAREWGIREVRIQWREPH